jgi:hypothetical protein
MLSWLEFTDTDADEPEKTPIDLNKKVQLLCVFISIIEKFLK